MKNNFRSSVLNFHLSKFILLFAIGLTCTSVVGMPDDSNTAKKPIKVLLVGGGSSHDFDRWYKEADVAILSKDGFAEVKYTDNMDSILSYLPGIDVLYFTSNQLVKDPVTRNAIMAFVDSGKGLVLGHAGLWYNDPTWPEFNKKLVSGGSRGHAKYGPFDFKVVNGKHPVTKGVPSNFTLKDELYYQKVDPNGPGIEVLATASTEGSEVFPSVFVINHPKSRIVSIALGHDGESHDLDAYHQLLRNAVKWTAR